MQTGLGYKLEMLSERPIPNNSLVPFFVLTFAYSWGCWALAARIGGSAEQTAFKLGLGVLGGLGPSLVAFFLTLRREGLRRLWRFVVEGFDPRFSTGVYGLAVAIPLLLNGIAYFSTGATKVETNLPSLLGTFVIWFFLGGPFGEEFGWRGYALPRLMRRCNPLAASLILGVIWSAWHYPLTRLVGTTESQTPVWVFFLSTTAAAVTYTWVWLRSGKKLFAVLLLHAMVNITVKLFPEPHVVKGIDRSTYVEALLSMVLAAALVFLFGARLKSATALAHIGVR